MKKGQRIRILKTGELGTIADQAIITKNGKRRVYCQVRMDSNPQLDRWYYADQLGNTIEKCTVTFKDDRHQELIFEILRDYSEEKLSIKMTGQHPENLTEHSGTHVLLAEALMKGFKMIE